MSATAYKQPSLATSTRLTGAAVADDDDSSVELGDAAAVVMFTGNCAQPRLAVHRTQSGGSRNDTSSGRVRQLLSCQGTNSATA